jgi:hypothetical protein
VEYVVANAISELTAGKAKTNAEGLVLMTYQGNTEGLSITRFDKSYAFHVDNNQMGITENITVPSGFMWKNTKQSMVPAYSDIKN